MNKSLILLLDADSAFAADRYFAVDNVCAWHNALLLTDGSLAGNLPNSMKATSLP